MGNKVNISSNSLNKMTQETNSNLILQIYYLSSHFITIVNSKEIKKIHKKFQSLDKNGKGYVTIDDITKIPEIEKNPLRFYICQYLSNSKSGHEDEINFHHFIKILDIFKNEKVNEQYKCNDNCIIDV